MNSKNNNTIEVSVIVPVFNEAGNIGLLAKEIASSLQDKDFELIVVNDFSTDGTLAELKDLRVEIPQLRILSHEKNAGQSRAIRTGAMHAKGKILCMLDGDGQNVPSDLPNLLAHLQRKDAPKQLVMVGGVRQKRQDTFSKRLGSKLANAIRGAILADGTEDTGCGIKAIDRNTYLSLPFFDHQHRYIPALVQRDGLLVEFLPVQHRSRNSGTSKYSNFGRLLVAFRDLLGMKWLQARAKLPGNIHED